MIALFFYFLGHGVTCLVLVLVLISKCEQIEENDLKTSAEHGEEKKHVCSLYIYTDPYLWRHIYFLEGKKYYFYTIKIENQLSWSIFQTMYYEHLWFQTWPFK